MIRQNQWRAVSLCALLLAALGAARTASAAARIVVLRADMHQPPGKAGSARMTVEPSDDPRPKVERKAGRPTYDWTVSQYPQHITHNWPDNKSKHRTPTLSPKSSRVGHYTLLVSVKVTWPVPDSDPIVWNAQRTIDFWVHGNGYVPDDQYKEWTDGSSIRHARGRSNQKCIRRGAGPNAGKTKKRADDVMVPNPMRWFQIHTGRNGICDTEPVDPDNFYNNFTRTGMGLPNQHAITLGPNGRSDTPTTWGDDNKNTPAVNTGPNGICNSIANQ